jgi:hypothetical protein
LLWTSDYSGTILCFRSPFNDSICTMYKEALPYQWKRITGGKPG